MFVVNSCFYRMLTLVGVLLFLASCAVLQVPVKADYMLESAKMEFAYVKDGSFQMGATVLKDEQPVHRVTVSEMMVGMYEVTFEQYDLYCQATPECELPSDEGWGRGRRPVINVSWYDANNYATWLSSKAGMKFRLPSESEWEYFTRAGTRTSFWTGDSLPKGRANCRNCTDTRPEGTVEVGQFAPNPWKIYDTVGNVSEWVQDDFLQDYTTSPVDGSAAVAEQPASKVARGGSWIEAMKDSRASSRDYFVPETTRNYIGFRLVLDPASLPKKP